MAKGIIYCYTSPSGKVYIGKTIEEHKRKSLHRRMGENYNSDLPFHRAIRKYGFNNFKYEILCNVESNSIDVLNLLLSNSEREYIHLLHAYTDGYNCTVGGEGVIGLSHSKQSKELMSKNSYKRAILQYDKQGNFITEWESIKGAERELKLHHITKVCTGERKTCGGFVWKYKEVK